MQISWKQDEEKNNLFKPKVDFRQSVLPHAKRDAVHWLREQFNKDKYNPNSIRTNDIKVFTARTEIFKGEMKIPQWHNNLIHFNQWLKNQQNECY